MDVQGLPGGLDAVADDACADGVEAEGGAHHSGNDGHGNQQKSIL